MRSERKGGKRRREGKDLPESQDAVEVEESVSVSAKYNRASASVIVSNEVLGGIDCTHSS